MDAAGGYSTLAMDGRAEGWRAGKGVASKLAHTVGA